MCCVLLLSELHIFYCFHLYLIGKTLPEDLQGRTRILFEAVLWYAYRLLSTEQLTSIRLGGENDNSFDIDTYCTILYNDEIHTFDQVCLNTVF